MQRVEVARIRDRRFAIRSGAAEVHVRQDDGVGGAPTFRSGELLLGGLGSCTLGTLATFARNTGLELGELRATVEGEEAPHPRRISAVRLAVHLGGRVSERELTTLSRVAERCKVHTTLQRPPAIDLVIEQT